MDGQQIAALAIVALTVGLMARSWLRRRQGRAAGGGACARCAFAAGRGGGGELRKRTLERQADVH